jgi:polyhydroxyalkanoate synthesis regulator phasin
MRRIIAAFAAAVVVLGAVVAGVTISTPSGASAQETTEDPGSGIFVSPIQEALEELVASGTLNQAQVDAITDALESQIGGRDLERGHHGPGHLETVAEVLGMEVDDLKTALQDGQTIAEIAGDDVDAVTDALIAEANERIDQAVADGRLTADEAAEKQAEVAEKVEAKVNGEAGGRGFGPRRGPFGPDADTDAEEALLDA